MTIYANMLRAAGKLPVFEKPNEGNPGGGADDDAAKAAAAAAAAENKAPTDAEVKAAEEAAAKAAEAAKGSADPAVQKEAAEKAELLKEVMDKKARLKEANDARTAAEARLAAYEGIDPEEVKALMKAKRDADQAAAEAKGDFERVKTMMVDEHKKEVAKIQAVLDEERNGRKADQALIDELTIGNSFGNSEFIRESLTISPVKARRLYGDHFERQGGVVVAYDKPAGEKDRTMLVNSAGAPLSFEEALNRIVEADPDKKGVLRSKVKSGAGSNTEDTKMKPKTVPLSGAVQIAASLKSLVNK